VSASPDRRTEVNVEVEAVAYALARVISLKTIGADPGFKRLDALGRMSAAHTMALSMVPMLQDEAEAAISALRKLDAAPDPEEAQ
jgi:hypothetical protein